VAKAALNCARHSHPPNPKRAGTRSCPRRPQFHRARSASKEGTWPLPSPPSKLACFPAPSQAIRRFPEERGLVDPRLRASNEHLPSVRVPRAGGQPGHTPLPLQARSYTLQEGGVIWSLTARIEGAHSDRAASASTGDQSGLSSLPQPLR